MAEEVECNFKRVMNRICENPDGTDTHYKEVICENKDITHGECDGKNCILQRILQFTKVLEYAK